MDDPAPATGPSMVDFEQSYQDRTLAPGDEVMERLPWEIDRPQPELVRLDDAGHVRGDVLDIGCGPGDSAVYLAGRGYRVTGLDVSPTVVEKARARAAAERVAVSFAVADAVELAGYDGRFDTVVSSALFHCLEPEQRRPHVAALRRVTRPGARLVQFTFATSEFSHAFAPYAIGEDELRDIVVRAGWSIDTLRPGDLAAVASEPMLASFAESGFRPDIDDDGSMLLPIWVLVADRA